MGKNDEPRIREMIAKSLKAAAKETREDPFSEVNYTSQLPDGVEKEVNEKLKKHF